MGANDKDSLNAAIFRKKVKAYFKECEDAGGFADEAGLMLSLGLTRVEYETYLRADDPRLLPYRRALEEAALLRESILTREIFAAEKGITGKMFLARTDTAGNAPTGEQNVVFSVHVTGDADFLE
ncbi:MAG: hypothetical protein LBT36_02065 [Oscillospiraceae bacterium]|jgi:hypothetical protein|nr:hypothetical protein [Oscillospiraceae bacterium]